MYQGKNKDNVFFFLQWDLFLKKYFLFVGKIVEMVFGDRVWEKIEDIKSVYFKFFGNFLVNIFLDVFIVNFNDMLCF